MKKIALTVLGLSLIFLIPSCTEDQDKGDVDKKTSTKKSEPISPESVSNGGNVIKLQNQLFSIPSPVQTAILIRKQNIEFDESLISDFSKVDTYITKVEQALNLGVLGSDLAYLSNYNDIKKSLECLSSVEELAEKLDVAANIDPTLLKRFNENLNNVDSLNVLNAAFYKNAERYLKDNLENESASLILTGGWIESMHFATQNTSNKFLRSRVAEQKSTVENLTKLLNNFSDARVKVIAEEMRELANVYQSLSVSYEYAKPITDKESKTTYLKSKTSISASDKQLEQIKNSVLKIRNLIIA